MSEETQPEQPERLPLWRNVAQYIEENHKPGDMIEASWLLQRLRHTSVTDMRFGLDVSNIRRYLEAAGMYLSGTGFKGEKFALLLPKENHRVMQAYGRAAVDKMHRAVTLGNNTDRATLTAEESVRHESLLSKMAARLALIGRRNPEKILAETAKTTSKQLTA